MDKRLAEQENNTRSSIYDFIVEFITSNGYSPSLREIAKGTGIKSTSTIHDQLLMLERLGLVHTQGKPRTISLAGYQLIRKESN